MRKVDDREKKKKRKKKEKRKKENNDVYSGHYVIASRPPERRPTGMPHARAKIYSYTTCQDTLYAGSHVDSADHTLYIKSYSSDNPELPDIELPTSLKLAQACSIPAFGVRVVDCWQ